MLDVQMVRQSIPVALHSDNRIEVAIANANRVIRSQHGPEYEEGKYFQAEYDYEYEYPRMMHLGRNAERVISVNGSTDLSDVILMPPSVVKRVYSYWYGDIRILFEGVDDREVRDSMALQLIGKELLLDGYKDLSMGMVLDSIPRMLVSGPRIPNRLTLVDM